MKFNRRMVDKQEYFEQKYTKAAENWERAKEDYKTTNEGVVIVVFKTQECVTQTIEELDIVKEKLADKP